MQFIETAHKGKSVECIFCDYGAQKKSIKNLVLHRGKYCYVILNRFPYTNGHLMVIPYQHTNRYEDLTNKEHLEIGQLISRSITCLKTTLNPHGCNIGMNLGEAAGAGIKHHLHYHVVPRWIGDANFMPIIGKTRAIPEFIEVTYKKMSKKF